MTSKPETQAFPTADVLGVLTYKLLGGMDGIYAVAKFMAGTSVYTHQLPRFMEAARVAILAVRPDLHRVVNESEEVDGDTAERILFQWVTRYGPAIEVPVLSPEAYAPRDPMEELVSIFGEDNVIAVQA